MAAAAADRRRAKSIELAMEIVAIVQEDRDIDRRGDEQRGIARRYARAAGRWMRERLDGLPGGQRVCLFLVGVLDALRAEDALEQLEDRNRDRVCAAATELAGMLDFGEPSLFRASESVAQRESGAPLTPGLSVRIAPDSPARAEVAS